MEDLSVKQLVMNMSEELKEYKKQTDRKFDKHEDRMDKQDERMDKMNDTQIIHGQQINGILETLRDIKGDTVWLRRTVTGAVLTGAISAIIGFIVFAIQNFS